MDRNLENFGAILLAKWCQPDAARRTRVWLTVPARLP